MTYKTAQILGALMAVGLVGGVVVVGRSLPAPCKGALTLQLKPPLTQPGTYAFDLSWPQTDRSCRFEVKLASQATVTKNECDTAWQLQLQQHARGATLSGLLLASTPSQVQLQVRQNSQVLFDSEVRPEYGAALRVERGADGSERFCGASALASVECVPGTPQCTPYTPLCDGPEDCPTANVCCAAPAWARDYGADRAMECTTRTRCLGRIESFIVCHDDSQCPSDHSCASDSVGKLFKPELQLCLLKPAAPTPF